MKPSRQTEFTIVIEQTPGQLAGLLEAAAAANVEIHAVSVNEHQDRGLIRLVGSPVEALRRLLEQIAETGAGTFVENPILQVNAEGRPSALREIAARLAQARVNIRHVYMAPRVNGTPQSLLIAVDDVDRALAEVEALAYPPAEEPQPSERRG